MLAKPILLNMRDEINITRIVLLCSLSVINHCSHSLSINHLRMRINHVAVMYVYVNYSMVFVFVPGVGTVSSTVVVCIPASVLKVQR